MALATVDSHLVINHTEGTQQTSMGIRSFGGYSGGTDVSTGRH